MAERKGRSKGSGYVYESPKGSGKWWARVEWGFTAKGKRRYRKRRAKSRPDAEAQVRKLLAEREQYGTTEPNRQSVAQFLKEWLSDVVLPGTRPNTYRAYAWAVKHIETSAIGRARLRDLTRRQVQRMVADLSKGGKLGPQSVARVLSVLQNALNVAEDWERVTRNVADKVAPPKLEDADHVVLTPKQAEHFLHTVRNDRFLLAYVFGLTTTLRVSEVLGLRWQNVDWERQVIMIRHRLEYRKAPWHLAPIKSRAGRRAIWLPDSTMSLLHELRGKQMLDRTADPNRADHDFILATSNGTPVSPTNMTRRYLKNALKTAKLPPMKFHELRHSAASILAAKGVHPDAIRALMGHSNAALALTIYTTTLPGVSQAASEELGKLLAHIKDNPELDGPESK